MKKSNYIFILFIIPLFTIHFFTYSQGCLPEGITFTSQQQIDNFQTNYPGCTEIEGDVEILYSDIVNLDGLNVLSAIGGGLEITGTNITSLSGLDNINSIGGDLVIWQNTLLTGLSNLENLISIGGSIEINNNPLIVNLNGLENTLPNEDIIIENNIALVSLAAFENLSSIGGALFINGNISLPDFSGFENLTYVEGILFISYNSSLTNLSGLDNVSYSGGGLGISNNSALEQLTGLENLTSIGGPIAIDGNNSLVGLNGIQNLTSIGGFLVLDDNNTLSDISGLASIEPGSITDLHIINNDVLSNCDIQSICEYLASPNGTVDIHDNAPECNSQTEIELHCLSSEYENLNPTEKIKIFPNPAKNSITILCPESIIIQEVIIYNQTGNKVYQSVSPGQTIDISNLQSGLYFVEIVTENKIAREKLIIK